MPIYCRQSVRSDFKRCFMKVREESIGKTSFIHYLLILAEDHRTELHFGVDFIAIVRAFKVNLLENKRQGASTIEQQLVRVITARREMTKSRKLREQLLAISICLFFSKKQIYIAYINLGYYGEEFEHNKKLKLATYDCNYKLIAYLKYPKPSRPNVEHEAKIERRVRHIQLIESGSHTLIWRDNILIFE